MPGSRVALAIASALALLACSGHSPTAAPPAGFVGWTAPHGRDDPRVGRILDVAQGSWIDEAALLDALATADFVLLGERHDHPDHHVLQARIVRALVVRGRRPAVAFEMLDAEDAQALAALDTMADSTVPARAEALRRAVEWDQSGWPDWALYAPVFETALAAALPIVPANLARAELHAIRRGGAAALAPERRAELGLDEPPDPDEFRALADQIREAHCGHAPDAALDRMVEVQRAWNAQLAGTLAAAGTSAGVARGAVLIAGSEHVRRDRGAPRRLTQLAPGARIAALGFLEIDPRDPDALPDASAPFDYLWLTPRVDLEDPCEKYRDALEKLRQDGGASPDPGSSPT
jgi:uncharacterized iron-regulated protein